jgi:hypothetical protein
MSGFPIPVMMQYTIVGYALQHNALQAALISRRKPNAHLFESESEGGKFFKLCHYNQQNRGFVFSNAHHIKTNVKACTFVLLYLSWAFVRTRNLVESAQRLNQHRSVLSMRPVHLDLEQQSQLGKGGRGGMAQASKEQKVANVGRYPWYPCHTWGAESQSLLPS